MTPNLSHDADAFISLLWRHIYQRVRGMLHPHHYEHEPGGKDEIDIPLGFLSDVTLDTPVTGEVLTYNTDHWENGEGGGAGGFGQAFFEVTGTITTGAVPGPTNLTGGALTIEHVFIASDGEVAGTAAGQGFSFAAGGGTDDNTGLSVAWSDGAQLSITISSVGADPTYLTCDVYFTV